MEEKILHGIKTWLTVVCETKQKETKWNETKWESVVCEMKICSLRNENPLQNADFKFSVNNEGEDVNKEPRLILEQPLTHVLR